MIMACLLDINFNPRSPRGGATHTEIYTHRLLHISIHAPHEGERRHQYMLLQSQVMISIHAPHEGERRASTCYYLYPERFQSTLPTRGSDCHFRAKLASYPHFNPRSPRGGATLFFIVNIIRKFNFNPRSPRGGATVFIMAYILNMHIFQSTLPTRGSDSGKVHLYTAFPRIC